MQGTLDIAPTVLWAGAFTTLINLAIIVWGIFSGPAKKAADALTALTLRVELNERATARLRDDVDRMPDKESLHRLELTMTRMEGHMQTIEAKLEPVAAIADRMQEIMLEEGRSK